MTRNEISLFLKNSPGELGHLGDLLGNEGINIEAFTIQDASSYVSELFGARGKALKRIASTQSYDSMRKDSEEFALLRLVVDKNDEAQDLLAKNGYLFEVNPIIGVQIENRPGSLAKAAAIFGRNNINILYSYGSVGGTSGKVLIIFRPEDMEAAAKVFK